MLAVQGYFDGITIQPLENITAKPNQKFIEPTTIPANRGIRGILSSYANPSLAEKEKGAWERAVVNKYGNV